MNLLTNPLTKMSCEKSYQRKSDREGVFQILLLCAKCSAYNFLDDFLPFFHPIRTQHQSLHFTDDNDIEFWKKKFLCIFVLILKPKSDVS
jgi:hypothetical protein